MRMYVCATKQSIVSLSLILLCARPLLQCQCSLTVHTQFRLAARVIEHTLALVHINDNDGHHSSAMMCFFSSSSSFSPSSFFCMYARRISSNNLTDVDKMEEEAKKKLETRLMVTLERILSPSYVKKKPKHIHQIYIHI